MPTPGHHENHSAVGVGEAMRVSDHRFILAAIFVLTLTTGPSSDVWSMGQRAPVVGSPAANFTLPDLDGHPRRLSEYRGKIVLLNFWATWCKPCTTEMPAMQTCYDKMKDKLVVLAINE